MRFALRAAATAAAALVVCVVAGTAGPSIASESDGTPTVPYAEHAATALTAATLGLNDLSDPVGPATDATAEAHAPAPVALHAVARSIPVPFSAENDDDEADRSLSDLVADYAASAAPDAETDCLARGIYYESKGEPLDGQLTVADVIVNRSRSSRFPSTICGVLRQPSQFSFVHRGVIPTPPAGSRDWRIAVAIAQIAMQDLADGAAPHALFFHARSVHPGWRLTRVATVGNHIFYR
jgi:spore germination cell wall hydrolase CwlJ-like protein